MRRGALVGGAGAGQHVARLPASGHAVHAIDLSVTARSPASALRLLCADRASGCNVVVDASGVDVLLPATLATLVRLRRRVAARNGGIVVVAGDGAVRSIRRCGLQHSLPCAPSLSEALDLLDERGRAQPGTIDAR